MDHEVSLTCAAVGRGGQNGKGGISRRSCQSERSKTGSGGGELKDVVGGVRLELENGGAVDKAGKAATGRQTTGSAAQASLIKAIIVGDVEWQRGAGVG